MRNHAIAFTLAFFLAIALPASAGTIYAIPPEAPPYLVNPSATSLDTLEAFIETPGVMFDNPGFNPTDTGWSATTVNPTYAEESGTPSSYLTESLNIAGGGSQSFTVNVYGFSGCSSQPGTPCSSDTLTDAYQVTFSDGSYQGWAALPNATASLGAENTAATPEPSSLIMVGLGLIGISTVCRRHKQNHT